MSNVGEKHGFEHVVHREQEPVQKGAEGAHSQELGSCVTPSPEPGSKMRAWPWGSVEGCLPLSYFFPLTLHELPS